MGLISAKLKMLRSKSADPEGAEAPPIEHHRHPHSHNYSGRTTGKETLREALFLVFHGKARPENMFEEALE